MVARSMSTIAGSTLCSVLASAMVSQTLTELVKLLLQGLGCEQVPAAYVDLADQVVHGLQYIFVMQPWMQLLCCPSFLFQQW